MLIETEKNGLLPATTENVLNNLYRLQANPKSFFNYLFCCSERHSFSEASQNNLYYLLNGNKYYRPYSQISIRKLLRSLLPEFQKCRHTFLVYADNKELEDIYFNGDLDNYMQFLQYIMKKYPEDFNKSQEKYEIIFAALHTDQNEDPAHWHIHFLVQKKRPDK